VDFGGWHYHVSWFTASWDANSPNQFRNPKVSFESLPEWSSFVYRVESTHLTSGQIYRTHFFPSITWTEKLGSLNPIFLFPNHKSPICLNRSAFFPFAFLRRRFAPVGYSNCSLVPSETHRTTRTRVRKTQGNLWKSCLKFVTTYKRKRKLIF